MALDVLCDYACQLMIAPEEVKREKGVILAEMRERDHPRNRLAEQWMSTLFKNTPFARASPVLGQQSIIERATAQNLRDFYEKWYTPNRMLLIMVGNFSFEQWIPRIEAKMTTIPAKTNLLSPHEGQYPTIGKNIYHYLRDEQLSERTIAISTLTPSLPKGSSIEKFRKSLYQKLGNAILRERLFGLGETVRGAFQEYSVSQHEIFLGVSYNEISITEPENWQQSLSLIEQEIRRIQLFGFSEEELERVRKRHLNIAEHFREHFETFSPETIAFAIFTRAKREELFLSPQDRYELMQHLLRDASVESVSNAWNELYPSERYILFSGPEQLSENIDTDIQNAYETSSQIPIEPLPAKVLPSFAYSLPATDEPLDSYIESWHYVEDLDFHQIVLKNHIRLNIKSTSCQKNRLDFILYFGSGALDLEKGQEGLAALAVAMMFQGGLQKHPPEELDKILSDELFDITNLKMELDHSYLTGYSSCQDFRRCCELLKAFIEDSAYSESIRQNALETLREMKKSRQSVTGVYRRKIHPRLSGNHPAFSIPSYKDIKCWQLEDVIAWIKEYLQDCYMELTIVGDSGIESILPTVGPILAQMPMKADFPKIHDKKSLLQIPPAEHRQFFYHDEGAKHSKAKLLVFWRGIAERNIELDGRELILTNILSERLTRCIRHEMGETYSPDVDYVGEGACPAYDWIYGHITLSPDKLKLVENIISKEIQKLVQTGITEDEFQCVIEPLKNGIHARQQTNDYWLKTLQRSQSDSTSLRLPRTIIDFFQNVSKEEVAALIPQIFQKERFYSYQILPQKYSSKRPSSRRFFH